MIKIEFSYVMSLDTNGEERPDLTVYWSFVPRQGEYVDLDGDDYDMSGYVHSVAWGALDVDLNVPVCFVKLK